MIEAETSEKPDTTTSEPMYSGYEMLASNNKVGTLIRKSFVMYCMR